MKKTINPRWDYYAAQEMLPVMIFALNIPIGEIEQKKNVNGGDENV